MLKDWFRDFIYHVTIRPRLERLKKLLPDASIYPTGSRYICNPPVFGTDIDFLVYSKEDLDSLFIKNKWYRKAQYEGTHFKVWHKGNLDLIVSQDEDFIDRHRVATFICREHNVRDKWPRVFLHQIIRDKLYLGYPAEDLYADVDVKLFEMAQGLAGPHGHALVQVYKIRGMGRG